MIDLPRLKMVHGRLTAAVRRHGLRTVAAAVAGALVRHGLVATVRLGGAERPFPWQREAARRPAAAPQPSQPADLDDAYGLAADRWERLRTGLGDAAPLGSDPREIPVLVFVVLGAELAQGDLERTRAACRRIGYGARLSTDPDTAPAAGRRFWVFLGPGDEPTADMPLAFAEAVRSGEADVVSFDLWTRRGERAAPLLAPGANPTLLRATDYLFSRLALADALLPDDAAPETLQPRALVLDWIEGLGPVEVRGRWRHIGRPLVQAAVSDEAIAKVRAVALEAGRRPVAAAGLQPVTVVICTKDKGHLTRQLVQRLLADDPALVGEVVIVSNNTTNPYALTTLEDLARFPRVRILRRDEPFNFSRLSNAGARAGGGHGPLLFLNDDVAPVSEDWLRRLGGRLDDPAVGSAGPLLLYPDERVQHAGMYLGCRGDTGHVLRGARLPENDYLFFGCAPREVSALTGACLLTSRAAFEALNGFDEQLATQLQDVDYCLRLRAAGLINVFEPSSVLIHMESASIGAVNASNEFQRQRLAERRRFQQRWGALLLQDPLHPRGFDPNDETLRRLARKPS